MKIQSRFEARINTIAVFIGWCLGSILVEGFFYNNWSEVRIEITDSTILFLIFYWVIVRPLCCEIERLGRQP